MLIHLDRMNYMGFHLGHIHDIEIGRNGPILPSKSPPIHQNRQFWPGPVCARCVHTVHTLCTQCAQIHTSLTAHTFMLCTTCTQCCAQHVHKSKLAVFDQNIDFGQNGQKPPKPPKHSETLQTDFQMSGFGPCRKLAPFCLKISHFGAILDPSGTLITQYCTQMCIIATFAYPNYFSVYTTCTHCFDRSTP
jgi:hypothetical protein